MHPTRSSTDADTRAALMTFTWLCLFLVLWGGLGLLVQSWRDPAYPLAFILGGSGLVLRRFATHRVVKLALRIHHVLTVVGTIIGNAFLRGFYLLVIYPYGQLLVHLGALQPPDEPWPPESHSGWVPLNEESDRSEALRRAMTGSFWAGLLVRAGGAAALLRYLQQRPSVFLIPLVIVMLLLGGFVLFGNATGLGPLIYTLF